MNEKYLRLLEENGKKGKYMTNPKNMRTMTISPLLIFEFGQTSSSDVASYWRMLRPFPPLCRPAWRSWYRTLMTVLVTFSHNCSFSWKFEIAGQNSLWDNKDFWIVISLNFEITFWLSSSIQDSVALQISHLTQLVWRAALARLRTQLW